MKSVKSTSNSKFGSNFQRKTNITARGFCQTMFLLSLVSFRIFLRILYYVSNGKYGRKKTDICDHCNESVGCWNARLSSQVCLQQSYKLDFGNR